MKNNIHKMDILIKNRQYFKFCIYGFLKNLRFFDAFFILFLIEKGLSFTQIGILYAVREIFTSIFEIPSGIIADTFGRKNSLIGSFFIFIVSFYVFYISNDFWFFLIAFILYGIGDAFRSGPHKGMIMDYLKLNDWGEQKINYYGHTRSWSQKGSAISSLLAGLIVFYSGTYQNIFLYSIIPYLLNLLLILSYPKELNHSFKQINPKSKRGIGLTIKSFLKIIKQPSVITIINTSAIHSAYLRAIKDYIQPLMVNIALIIPIMLNIEAEKKNGIIIGVIYFFIYLITSRASKFSSKIAIKTKANISNITLLLGFIFGIICGVFFILDLWIISMIAFIGIYIVENIRKPILIGLIADNVPSEILTSVISAQSLLRTILTVILALTFGIIADNFGIGVSFMVISIFLTLSTILIKVNK
ncbi:MAG: MFS transporter [Fluviicola sp.]|nr:MFS transporter [Fluviicola sp.]